MKDSSGKEVETTYGWGEERQKEMITKLCNDCCSILERVVDLENGAKKYPLGNYDPKVMAKWRSLDTSAPGVARKFEDSQIFQELPEDNSLPHKSNREDLRASSELGCIICTWLLRSLESRSKESNSLAIIEQWLKRPATVERDSTRKALSNRCVGHYRVKLRSPAPEPPHPSVVPFAKHESMVGNEQGELVRPSAEKPKPFNQLRGDELGSLVVDVIPSSNESRQLLNAMANLEPDTPSSSTWELFKAWLQACDDGHPECKRHPPSGLAQLPGRLIDVQAADTIRVVDTSTLLSEEGNDIGAYATLSHRWGGIHEPQLNERTSYQLQRGIASKDLPSLFRDTVEIVKSLGIPYLWIDSLCILQDSVNDWQRESSKMGSIYFNAYLCVAASAAENNLASILEKHTKDWPQPLICENLVIQADFSIPGKLAMQQPHWCARMRTLSEAALDIAPLNQRAWVLQERTFSPRILHCTYDEYIWECCRGMRSESHPLMTAGGSIAKDIGKQLDEAQPLLEGPAMQDLHLSQRLQLLERWSELIHIFSSTGISFPQDRLPACSALAKRLQPILGEYTAGLWRRYMPTQLLWRHHRTCKIKRGERHTLRRNKSPSWSWSSLDCRALLPYYYKNTKDDFPSAETRDFEELVDISSRVYIKIHNIGVKLSSEDATGAVEGGQIDLTGRLLPIYRSTGFGFWLNTEAPASDNEADYRAVHFTLDDPNAHGLDKDKAVQAKALQSVYDDEKGTTRPASLERYLRHYKTLSTLHSPKLTSLCFLPVTEQASQRYRQGKDKINTMQRFTLLCGLLLQHAEEKGEGVYRRVGYFDLALDEVEDAVKCKIDEARPWTDRWPSRKAYSPAEGFTISII